MMLESTTMKSRFALMLLALLPLFAACSAQDNPAVTPVAETAAAAATEPAPAPVEATPVAEAPADAASTAPVVATPPSGPAPVAGTDYVDISGGQAFAPAAGKVEVAEVFGYTCPHCAQFQPLIDSWKARQPADVNVVSVPAAFGGYWVTYARAFFAAETMGVLEKSHDAMFNALHVARSLGPDSTPEDIGKFYAQYGVDPKAFANTMKGFAVETKLGRAKQFAARSKVDATPSIVVNGKYLVMVDERGPEHMFNTIDHLVARERAGSN
jgi:thiol:disulfide interchange protein DsbA